MNDWTKLACVGIAITGACAFNGDPCWTIMTGISLACALAGFCVVYDRATGRDHS